MVREEVNQGNAEAVIERGAVCSWTISVPAGVEGAPTHYVGLRNLQCFQMVLGSIKIWESDVILLIIWEDAFVMNHSLTQKRKGTKMS